MKFFLLFSVPRYGWQTIFIQNFPIDPNTTHYSANITNLTQYTQYAYYVKTQVVHKEHEENVFNISQGQSNVIYFTTQPNIPTCPIVETMKKTNHSITLYWHPAVSEKEFITKYRVDIFIQPDEHDFLDSRDYCKQPKINVKVNVGVEVNEHQALSSAQCMIEYKNWRNRNPDVVDVEDEWQIYRKTLCIEQELHSLKGEEVMRYLENSQPFCSNDEECNRDIDIDLYDDGELFRFRRQIHDFLSKNDDEIESQSDEIESQSDEFKSRSDENFDELGEYFRGFELYKADASNATILDLLPYTMYIFQFFSCNEIGCSSYFFHFDRTESSIYADTIDNFTVTTDPNNFKRIHLDFDEPSTPNGLTVAFEIEKYRTSDYTRNVTLICITRKQHYDNGRR